VTTELIRKELIKNGLNLSNRNIFIEGVPNEFDLFIRHDRTLGINCYNLTNSNILSKTLRLQEREKGVRHSKNYRVPHVSFWQCS